MEVMQPDARTAWGGDSTVEAGKCWDEPCQRAREAHSHCQVLAQDRFALPAERNESCVGACGGKGASDCPQDASR